MTYGCWRAGRPSGELAALEAFSSSSWWAAMEKRRQNIGSVTFAIVAVVDFRVSRGVRYVLVQW